MSTRPFRRAEGADAAIEKDRRQGGSGMIDPTGIGVADVAALV
jgi:hypothetical protein